MSDTVKPTNSIQDVAFVSLLFSLLATPLYLAMIMIHHGTTDTFLGVARIVFATLIVVIAVCSSTSFFCQTRDSFSESLVSRISPRASASYSAILVSICVFILLGALGASPSVSWVIAVFGGVSAFSAGIWWNRTP